MKKREELNKPARLLIASGLFLNSANIIMNRWFVNAPDWVAILFSLFAIALIMLGIYKNSSGNERKFIMKRRGKDAQ